MTELAALSGSVAPGRAGGGGWRCSSAPRRRSSGRSSAPTSTCGRRSSSGRRPGVPSPTRSGRSSSTAALVATTLPLRARSAARAPARNGGSRSRRGRRVQAGYLAVQLVLLARDLDRLPPEGTAYASIYATLLGAHAAHVAAGMLLELWVLVRLVSGLTRYRLVALQVTVFYWLRQRARRGRGRGAALAAAMRRPRPRDAAVDRAARRAARLDGAARRGVRRDGRRLQRRRARRVAGRVAARAHGRRRGRVGVAGQPRYAAWRATRRAGTTPRAASTSSPTRRCLANTLFIVMILLGGITPPTSGRVGRHEEAGRRPASCWRWRLPAGCADRRESRAPTAARSPTARLGASAAATAGGRRSRERRRARGGLLPPHRATCRSRHPASSRERGRRRLLRARAARADRLRGLARARPAGAAPHPERGSVATGMRLFTEHCAGCHQIAAAAAT